MSRISLKDISTRAPKEFDKEETKNETSQILLELDQLQNLLFAENKHSVLIVIQGMDASGKDGLIRNVFTSMNPQGVNVKGFKTPTPEELSHDFLWRIHLHAPEKGMKESHSFAVLSWLAVARNLPSGLKLKLVSPASWPRNLSNSCPLWASQIAAVLSPSAVATRSPSGLNATAETPWWPLKVSTSSLLDISNSFTVLSLLAAARREPSGLNATQLTMPGPLANVSNSCPFAASHSFTV